jgi:S-adenosylmethionine:tRNA ribosyltransferase-isomerase
VHINFFNYRLSPSLIAKEPTSPRDACRLMVLDQKFKTIQDKHFFDLVALLRPGDVLVFNDSRVIPARILFTHQKKKIELFLIRPQNKNTWIVLGKPGKIFRKGSIFSLHEDLQCEVLRSLSDGQKLVRFSKSGPLLEKILDQIGLAPFPPYIKNSRASFEDYQTVYAKEKGSVAAPTAGLHFTPRLLKKLKARGIQLEFVTLHVGPGTFMPVKTRTLEHHRMHSEFFTLRPQTAKRLNKARKEGQRIIAVGTTSVRVLESNFHPQLGFRDGQGETKIFIYPGYRWKCVDGLITNFHLPKSTLLALTCSFGGYDFVMKAYREAIKKRYRFYSFGDTMLIN